MSLTQVAITRAAVKAKPYKLVDGFGLHLLVKPNGSKLWRFRYRFAGRENMLSFGAFPETTLAEAREERDAARKLLKINIDPSQHRKTVKLTAEQKASNTFKVIAAEYIQKLKDQRMAPNTISKNEWLLGDLCQPVAYRPITEITAAELLDLLKKVEKSGRRETARRLKTTIGSVFRFAIVNQKAENDPTSALRGALLKPIVTGRAAITDEKDFGKMLVCIDEYDGWPTIRAALQLLALTMVRPAEIRFMERSELDLDKRLWSIPAEKMKMRLPHIVPLSTQAVAILQDIAPLSGEKLVLPSVRSNSRPLSENAMNSALRRMGYTKAEVTSHGFRSSASTILNTRGFNPDHIEAALAHQEADEVRRAYNRATYLNERIVLMQEWADLLDTFRAS